MERQAIHEANEKFTAIMQRIGDDWMHHSEQLIVNRLDGVEQRIGAYSEAHPDIWPTMTKRISDIYHDATSHAQATTEALAYMQTVPGMTPDLRADYICYYLSMDIAYKIVQKFAADQVIGGFNEMEQRVFRDELQETLQLFGGLGNEQAKLAARTYMRHVKQLVSQCSADLGYADASTGRALA